MARSATSLDHIARITPPWRDPVYTECGRALTGRTWLTHGQYAAKRTAQGAWAKTTTCGTCAESAAKWHAPWDEDPAAVIGHDLQSAWENTHRKQLRTELAALGELARRHPQEFAELLAQYGAPAPAAPRRGLRAVRAVK
jgi:hypothetical protein